ncbi:MAG: winged helix-turn-helix domain-containing protein [Nitrososphaeraceae archaeon]
MSSKRSPLDIFSSILLSLAESKLKKTHVTYKANLDSRLASKYLRALSQLEMISKSSEDPSYFIITQKGRDFLEQYNGLIKTIDL